MKKTILLLLLLLTASMVVGAQSKSRHKPSAAVRKGSQATATPKSTSAPKPAPAPIDAGSGSAAAPAEEKLQSTGPLYPDEKGPLPASINPVAKKVGPTPSDLPTGTAIRMNLQTPLSSRDSHEGDAFSGRVTEAVVIQGRIVIPVGASITGHLLRVSDPRRIAGTGSLRLRPESVMLPNGQTYAINASMVDTSTPKKLTVDEEGRIKARGLNGGDKAEMIAGTGAGAVAGTIIAGGRGTLVGSMIVGGATVVHWLTRRHPVDVPAGTELIMEISHPMTLSGAPMQTGE